MLLKLKSLENNDAFQGLQATRHARSTDSCRVIVEGCFPEGWKTLKRVSLYLRVNELSVSSVTFAQQATS